MKLDLLAISAHPDDAELGCSGALMVALSKGKRAGIVDLTRGEMGTRGTVAIRDQEAADAAQIMGLTTRENLNFKDIYFTNDDTHQIEVVKMIRKYQPEVIITGAIRDRHPDHAKGSALVKQACFM
ncbi:MAG: PIG-L family deacetylase, partial [Cyclobacteriaceae bacterium]